MIEPSDAVRAEMQAQGYAVFETLETALEDGGIDGVVIATPTTLHVEQARVCIVRETPVLIEKPLADDATAAAALVAEAEAAGVPVLVGHHRRHNPLIASAKAVIERGEIGAVRAVHVQCWFHKPDYYFAEARWRTKKGAGPVSVNLAHDVDLLRYLCGNITRVTATAAPSSRGFENEEVAAAILNFESGAVGTISVSDGVASPWSWELTSGENPAYPKTDESCCLIGGDRGSLSIPDVTVWRHTGDKPDWWTPISGARLPRSNADPLVRQLTHFGEVIAGEVAPLVSGAEGLASLRVLEAIQVSAASGAAIDL